MKLIIANTDTILEASETVTELSDRWETSNAQYPKVVVTSIQEVTTLPEGFDTRYCVWNGSEIICTFPEPETPPTIIPSPITARQFLIQLAVTGIITPTEALAAAQNGTVPAAIDAVFETLPASDALGARITWARMTEVPRDDPLFLVAGPALGLTPEEIDQFFIDAAAIP